MLVRFLRRGRILAGPREGRTQGGFSRPSADSPSAPPLRVSKTPSEFGQGVPLRLPPWMIRAKRSPSSASHTLGTFPLGGGRLGRPGVPPLQRGAKPDSASGTGDREGRPYGFTKAYLKPWRAGEDTRPYGVFNTGSVCSVNLGAVVEPHQRKFMQTQGPVARQEFRPATQILRAGNIAKPNKYASPVMGVRG